MALSIVWAHSVFTAGFCAYVFSNLMQYTLVRESVYWVVLLVIVLVSAYAVSGGIESRARVYEILFWLVLVPFTGMLFAAIKNFELAYTEGIFYDAGKQVLKGSYLVFLFLTPLFFSLFLIKKLQSCSLIAVIFPKVPLITSISPTVSPLLIGLSLE